MKHYNFRRMKIYRLLYIILLFIFSGAAADEVEFTASAPRVVEVGEQFRLTFTVNAEGKSLKVPPLENFNLLSGPSTSSSSNIQVINGKMSKSVTYSYTYILQAVKPGKFKIAPASVKVNNKTYKTDPFVIEVVKGSSNPPAGNQQQSGQTTESGPKPDNEDIFVRVEVSDRNVYLGQDLVATIKIYTRLDLAGFENAEFPTFKGFWSQDLESPSQISLQRVNYNGKIYNAGLIKKVLLFPQQTGKIKIEPFVLDCLVKQRTGNRGRSIFDSFFDSYRTAQLKLKSKPITINVRPLPPGKPESFTGAVGNLKISSDIEIGRASCRERVCHRV